jgi:hypothetical protein
VTGKPVLRGHLWDKENDLIRQVTGKPVLRGHLWDKENMTS